MKKHLFLIIALFLLSIGAVRAQSAGDLDPAFGTGGKVITNYVGSNVYMDNSRHNVLQSVVLQTDGKIIVAGYANNRYGIDIGNTDFALARYNNDGTLDATFGIGGIVTHRFCA